MEKNKRRILVIESEPFLAAEYTKILSEAGNLIVGPFSVLQGDAQRVLVGREADGVILSEEDVIEGVGEEVRDLLHSGIPFFLILGKPRGLLDDPLRQAHSVPRPCSAEQLLMAVRSFF